MQPLYFLTQINRPRETLSEASHLALVSSSLAILNNRTKIWKIEGWGQSRWELFISYSCSGILWKNNEWHKVRDTFWKITWSTLLVPGYCLVVVFQYFYEALRQVVRYEIDTSLPKVSYLSTCFSSCFWSSDFSPSGSLSLRYLSRKEFL